ncbi:MAG: NAD-dependent epimerase/dehydratase family protein [Cytophagales bacterium]|nr:NAD-dependent epimerase/dehydratase family protein [Cytophagales bacterium]
MIYVTGATGMAGRAVCKQFLKQGKKLRCLKRLGSAVPASLKEEPIEWVEGDITDLQAQLEYMQDAEQVIHMAGLVSFRSEDKKKLQRINIEGTRTIVDSCLASGVPELLYMSSIASLAGANSTSVLNERTKWENGPNVSHYARSKYLAELEVWRGKAEGLKVIVFNPSVILGPGKPGKSSFQLIEYLAEGKRAFPNRTFHYVDARDAAKAVWSAFEKKRFGECYILSAEESSYQTLYEEFASLSGNSKPFQSISETLLRIAYALDWLRSRLTARPQKLSKELLKTGRRAYQCDSQKAREELGIEFRKLNQTLPWIMEQLEKEEKTDAA